MNTLSKNKLKLEKFKDYPKEISFIFTKEEGDLLGIVGHIWEGHYIYFQEEYSLIKGRL